MNCCAHSAINIEFKANKATSTTSILTILCCKWNNSILGFSTLQCHCIMALFCSTLGIANFKHNKIAKTKVFLVKKSIIYRALSSWPASNQDVLLNKAC